VQHQPPQAEPEQILPASADDLVERVRQAGPRDAGQRPIGWSRTGLAVGAIVLTAAVVGAWAGLDVGDAEKLQPAQRAVKVALPAAKPLSLPAPRAAAAGDPGAWEAPAALAARHMERRRSARQSTASEDRLADISQSLESGYPGPSAGQTSDQAAAEAPAVRTVAASLPLPNRVIARTIERIGYGCGEISSTIAGDAPGVYKVTCTSGQSYQATPVRGRYRFRRLAN
jgi:hypothetical protein